MIAIASTSVMTYVATDAKRDRENELLRIGQETVHAIALYYTATPGSVKKLPANLEDLLEDRRQIGITRYMREIYPDPTTGKMDWDLVRDKQGGIRGIRSTNDAAPLRAGVAVLDAWSVMSNVTGGPAVQIAASTLQPALHYSDWVFEYQDVSVQPGQTAK
ncbi:type II secretion system protein [Rhodoferax sp. GW822-FHT02A01]|uniref:type II secretion system protein n=1 Tax=Rhodoferax sp. GW822-FHT02A01 TaxID=3141537 RepID=UPI00315D0D8F